jgi:hypothetical protein
MSTLGIDTAGSYQGVIPASTWPVLDFYVTKASQGVGFTDPHGAQNLASALAHNTIAMGYHFADTTGSGAAQCDHFLACMGDLNRPLGFALDVEHGGLGASAPLRSVLRSVNPRWDPPPAGSMIGPASAIPGVIVGFIERFAQRMPGKPLFVYSNRGLWASSGGGTIYPKYPFVVEWHAGSSNGVYTPVHGSLAKEAAGATINPTAFGGMPVGPAKDHPVMVQFSDHSQVPGLGSGVDGDLWTGTLAQLESLIGGIDVALTTAEIDAIATAVINKTWALSQGEADLVKNTIFPAPVGTLSSIREALTYGGRVDRAEDRTRLETAIQKIDALAAKVAGLSTPTIDIPALAAAIAADLPAGDSAAIVAAIEAWLARP